ncbi:MAG: hypothetical protein ACNA71_06500 [Kiritimatiellia bacterium]
MRTSGQSSLGFLRWIVPVVLVVAVVAMGVRAFRVAREMLAVHARLDAATQRQAEQTLLYPLYLRLMADAEAIAQERDLVVSGSQALVAADLPAISDMLQKMITQHGFESRDIGFQVRTANGQRYLGVSLPVQGRYRDLGPLLADVIRQPYLLSFDRLSAVWGENRDEIEIAFKFALE